MAFKKGESGNPDGRPKTPPEVKKMLDEKGIEALKGLFELAKSAKDEKVKLDANKEILNRWLGKVPDSLDMPGKGGAVTIKWQS